MPCYIWSLQKIPMEIRTGFFCGLFEKLNSMDPEHFDMNPKVKANGCCDGWTPQNAEFKKETFLEFLNKKIKL